ncbi:hypothetical protein Tco_0553372 [Tanacetum coccineum]
MIGWLEENDGVNEGVNNEDIEDEDVEIELNDDAELIFPYEVEGDKTPPPRDESSDSEPPNAEHYAKLSILLFMRSHLILYHLILSQRKRRPTLHLRTLLGLLPKGLMLFATFRGASRARSRVTEAEMGTCQTEIALLKSKNKIGEKEREILDHDLGNVEHVLGDVLERLKVLESEENATSKKKLVEAEMKLELARMKRDMAERRLHASYG